MTQINRRQFLKYLGANSALLPTFGSLVACSGTSTSGRVVVVGGGFGGATCAKYLNKFDPKLDVTLIEPAARFITCPFSNMVLSGIKDYEDISHDYAAHQKRGVKVVQDYVQVIDAVNKHVTTRSGKKIPYDKLVLSPGIDFKWDEIEGMSAKDSEVIPHAWQGGSQTTLLRKQLLAMEDGGVVIVAPPENPFRCPPGPYERASMIAHYLKNNKPKSKILILDAKSKFSKQALFTDAWNKLYPGMIEWVSGDAGGRIDTVDIANRTIHTESGDAHKGSVVNLIPPQKSAELVINNGLTNNDGWCPVNQRNFQSDIHEDIHVIGDASIAGKMPKSGFAANSQGKVCAAAIVSDLHGLKMPDPSYVNTCYSLVSPDYGISVAAVYRFSNAEGIYKVKGSGGVSPIEADAKFRKSEAFYAEGWYASITSDTFG